MEERVNTPISTQELERRWKAIRAAMEAQGVDVLVVQSTNDVMGGYVKYFTDFPATHGVPTTVIFPKDDLMTVIRQGGFGGVQDLNGKDPVRRGVKQILTAPSHSSAWFTFEYDAEIAARVLAPFAKGTIGLVGTYQLSHAHAEYLKKHFGSARFVEASDLVDRIKVIKSEEEQELCIRCAQVQDGALAAAWAGARPGMTDREVAAIAQNYAVNHGSEAGNYLCGSSPINEAGTHAGWHMMERVIQEGDFISLLVESNGPGGYYTELGRSGVFGKVPQKMQDEFAFVLEARKVTLDLLKPGTPSKLVWDEFNAFMTRNGRPEEKRLYCHGMGYDMVERPLVRKDEPMTIQAGMNIVVHPTYVKDNMLNWVCDNYLIGNNGPGDRMHEIAEKISELG